MVGPHVADDGVHDERGELAADDHQLVTGDQATAALGRRDLGEIDRHGHRRATDGEAEDEPEDHHHSDIGREYAAHGAEEEQHGEDEDVVASAAPVGQATTRGRAEGGAEEQDARDQALGERGEAEVVLHRLERAVDDAGVVAEEQTTEGGDDGDEAEAARMRARRVRRKRNVWMRLEIQHNSRSSMRQTGACRADAPRSGVPRAGHPSESMG